MSISTHDRRRRFLGSLAAGAVAAPIAGWPPSALAADDAVTRLVVTFPPGGSTDIAARAIQPRLAEVAGHQVIVENRPGAASQIATQYVARAAPELADFLEEAEAVLEELDLEGVLQIASFHPRFQFYGTRSEDITNATNRSPYPTLHLIRETSIDRAVAAFPEAETIFEANMQTLRDLGEAGWLGLDVGAHSQTEPGPPSPTGREIST